MGPFKSYMHYVACVTGSVIYRPKDQMSWSLGFANFIHKMARNLEQKATERSVLVKMFPS